MQRRLEETIPGQAVLLNQPIAMRFRRNHGRGPLELVCKNLWGCEFLVLEQLAEKVRDILLKFPAPGMSELDKVGLTPQLEIRPNRDALQRYALQAEDVNRTRGCGTRRSARGIPSRRESSQIPVVVRLSRRERADGTLLNRLPVGTGMPAGWFPLGRLASRGSSRGNRVGTIAREGGQRRVAILVNVRGRDTGGFVAEASQRIQSGIQFRRATGSSSAVSSRTWSRPASGWQSLYRWPRHREWSSSPSEPPGRCCSLLPASRWP